MMARKAYIRTTLEDGSVEEVEVILDKTPSEKKPVRKNKEVSGDKDKKKQKKVQTPRTSKETISIRRTES